MAANPANRIQKFLPRTGPMSDTISTGAELSGRVIGKEVKMTRSRYQTGSLFVRGKRKKVYVARYYEDVMAAMESRDRCGGPLFWGRLRRSASGGMPRTG